MESIIGIDFGTTNSEVVVLEAGGPRIATGPDGERILPSALYIDEGGRRYVGAAARNVAILHPDRTVLSIKREMGNPRKVWLGGKSYRAEELASTVFAALKTTAEQKLGRPAAKAIVTVPAYFDNAQRQAVKNAAALAGLEVMRLVNEPTAAALAYGVDSGERGTVLVYDLGGGTFDVSVLEADEGVFQVLATRGDSHLGGDDFDQRIARLLCERFREETSIDLRDDPLAMQKVRQEAERAKISLSERQNVEIEIPFIAANAIGPCHLLTRLDRRDLEELIGDYVERTVRLTKGALQDAGLSPRDIDRVLLVGGSTRIPAVRRAVERLFEREIDGGVDPEEAVAMGAGIEASILCGQRAQTVLVDVTPLGLGVESADGSFVKLLERNSVLPARASAVFTTVTDFQRSARIRVLQGERPAAGDDLELGCFELERIENARKGEPEIEVTFDIDVEGIIHVGALDRRTGSTRHIDLSGVGELSQEEIERVLVEARASELEDIFSSPRREVNA